MAVIAVSGVAFAHPGGAELFREASFKVGSGAHVALVGQNGIGKSTLLRCIVGDLRPVEGTIRTDAAVAYMPQTIGSDTSTQSIAARSDTTVRELLIEFDRPEVRDAARTLAAAEHANDKSPSEDTGNALATAVIEWAEVGGYQAESKWDAACDLVLRQTLDRAGNRPISELSGGERKRLVLESLFASDVPILLLDEPDNFLDIPGKRWLERRIASSQKTILFISHDRELLTETATAVVTIEVNGCWTHPEGWVTYNNARRNRNESMGDALQRWKDEERRLFRYMREMKQRASVNDDNAPRANAAETRWKRFVDIGAPPTPPPDRTIHVRLKGAPSGKIALRCDALELLGLTDSFDLEVHHGERVAVLGRNGTGKSHFLRFLAGDLTVDHKGTFRLGARSVPGLFHQTDDVPEHRGRQLVDILSDHDLNEERARAYLGRYGLADAARREVETLSGGQRARLQVLDLELRGVNLLLLDEPTDNLDLESAETLEVSLETFEGTVICVTHDRSFMRSMDRWLIFDDDGSVREALDLDTALNVVTGDARYPRSKSGLMTLT